MIRRYLPVMLLIFASLPLPAQTRQANSTIHKRFVDDNNNFTSTGNIGMTVTNYGVFGDGFVEQAPTDQPSCEYPRGSGIEHIFDGGLWVGAETPTGIRVTTGAFNSARIGSAGSVNFEFTNTAEPTDIVVERSSLPANKFFSPQAISHQDFIIDFS
ncbi:MAG: hypothetical protein KDH84_10950, partial [Calditrichaeota bacterium]|nr:hypothetical protein [Calditrichota bacterium]